MSRNYNELLPRVLVRLFPDETDRAEAIHALSAYGSKEFHGEVARVHLGVLRLSGADLLQIKKYTDLACVDFRDLLVAAEYAHTFLLPETKSTHYTSMQQKERDEYDQWLARVLGE